MPANTARHTLAAALLLLAPAAARAHGSASPGDPDARALLDTAIARMGGAERLRGIARARFELLTQWQRTSFDGRPGGDGPSYESHSDLRDYTIGAWRNTRRFLRAGPPIEVVDVVRDSVATRRSPGGPGGVASPANTPAGAWAPLNVAYVDERRELFALAPERLLLAARDAADLARLRDTVIAGAPHARVRATIGGTATTVLLRRTDGFLAGASWRAAQPNDFGLVPWGTMAVELWYSAWRPQREGIAYPTQWDVRRVGQPYKRVTVLGATFNPPTTPDSFAVSDSLRRAFAATATRPMHDIPLDSARTVAEGVVAFATPGAPVGAVKVGTAWLLLEGGQAPLTARRAAEWLRGVDAGARVAHAVVTLPSTGHGGAAWVAGAGATLLAGPGTVPYLHAVLFGHGVPARAMAAVTRGRWVRAGGDSLWVEPIDYPDMPGALLVYLPSRAWVYSGPAASPLARDLLLARVRARGWQVAHLGTVLAPWTPVTPVTPTGR